MTASLELHGRCAVVTGGGGGLGSAYAVGLARRGAAVVVNDVSATAAAATAAAVQSAGGRALASVHDIATEQGATAVVADALAAFGSLDVVVNNAGAIADRTFAKMTVDDFSRVLQVNLLGTFFLSHQAFPLMKEARFGRFVHTTSAAGLFGNVGQSNYATAKMGVVGLSRTLALEGARYGVMSNVVAPVALTPAAAAVLGPVAELATAEQVSPLVEVLCAPGCPVTGEVFSAFAGRYARVFVGLSPGWFAGAGAVPSADEVLEHLGEIRAEAGYTVPGEARDELALVLSLLERGTP